MGLSLLLGLLALVLRLLALAFTGLALTVAAGGTPAACGIRGYSAADCPGARAQGAPAVPVVARTRGRLTGRCGVPSPLPAPVGEVVPGARGRPLRLLLRWRGRRWGLGTLAERRRVPVVE